MEQHFDDIRHDSGARLGGLCGQYRIIGIALGSCAIEGRGVGLVEWRVHFEAGDQIGVGDRELAIGDGPFGVAFSRRRKNFDLQKLTRHAIVFPNHCAA